MLAIVSQILFNLGLVLGLLLTWIWARVALFLSWPCQTGCFRKAINKITLTMISVLWKLPFIFSCCFISVQVEGISEMRSALSAKRGKPRVVLQNHLSFLDAVLATQFVGCGLASDMKSMASEHLFKMPLLGPVCVACGHLAVPFKTQDTKAAEKPAETEPGKVARKGSVADFSVDKDAVQKVTALFEEHVQAGGLGAWYPEGRLNPDPEGGLQQFRAGGFKLVVDVDCEIWCCVTKNNEKCWPRKAALGGRPATIYGECFKLCDSSHDFVKAVEGDDRAKAIYIANEANGRMSDVFERLGPQDSLLAGKA